MKRISAVTPCYNEEGNVQELYERVKKAIESTGNIAYEHIFIDNASEDGTVAELKELGAREKGVKVIVNTRNFGQIRSAFHGYIQATGDATICIVADLQDPPELIPEFIKRWEAGYKIVVGVKAATEDSVLLYALRQVYYRTMDFLSDIKLVRNFTGFGLYDRKVIEILRGIDDPFPHFRGLICDIGYEWAEVPYTQPRRKHGVTKQNFYSLYEMAMLSVTYHSKVPLRVATILGFTLAMLSLLVSFGYFAYKLVYWESFSVGVAPVVIGLFFFGAVQLFFLGIIGEYVGSIYTQVLKRPHVFEKERVNF